MLVTNPLSERREPKNLLIILPRQLGDVLLGTTLPTVLKKEFPNCRITWCAHPMAKQILEDNNEIDQILYHPVPPKKNPTMRPIRWMQARWNYLKSEIAFVWNLRAAKFDVVIDAMNNPRTAVQTFLTGAPTRISVAVRLPRNYAYNFLIPRHELDELYLGHARLKLLWPLGIALPIDSEKLRLRLPVSEKDSLFLKEYATKLAEVTTTPSFVLFSPTHRHAVRRWPFDSFIEAAKHVICKHGRAIVWLWGPGEEEFVRAFHSRLQDDLKKLGKNPEYSQMPPLFTLRQTAALAALAQGFLGNSNGLSHIAVAGGTKTIEMHGPTRMATWTPPDRSRHRGLQKSQGCTKCGVNNCFQPRHECMEDITVEQVCHEIDNLFFSSL